MRIDLLSSPAGKVVQHPNVVAGLHIGVRHVRADKACTAGD